MIKIQSPPALSTSLTPFTPLSQVAKYFKLPAYAVYRVAMRLGVAPTLCDKDILFPTLGEFSLTPRQTQVLEEALILLKQGIHLDVLKELLQEDVNVIEGRHDVGLKNMLPRPGKVQTLHQRLLAGTAWMPTPVLVSKPATTAQKASSFGHPLPPPPFKRAFCK
jgi:hypothetical protein